LQRAGERIDLGGGGEGEGMGLLLDHKKTIPETFSHPYLLV